MRGLRAKACPSDVRRVRTLSHIQQALAALSLPHEPLLAEDAAAIEARLRAPRAAPQAELPLPLPGGADER